MANERSPDKVVAYRLQQRFRYSYESSVRHVRQRLFVVPREVHGRQRRRSFALTIEGGDATTSTRSDGFGNEMTTVYLARVDSAVEFITSSDIDVHDTAGCSPVAPSALQDARYLESTVLTHPGRCLTRTGAELARSASGKDLATSICAWTRSAITYEFGVTTVRTTAAEVAKGGRGVCQDFAHVMIALCRSVGLPARYVSGHLVGEGGSHAWVEVLLSDEQRTRAMAFDPTHGRPTTSRYVTVAVGRDYADVAPTSGTFEGACSSLLTSAKRLVLRSDEPSTMLVST